MVTGGNRGLGLAIKQYFQAQNFSRTTGHDITNASQRQMITESSLGCDVFINNAFDGPFQESWADFGQCRLLYDIATKWRDVKKSGIIINIGSVGTETIVHPDPSWETYRIAKIALKAHSRQWTKAFKDDQVLFRTSLLTLDRLDTPLSRDRSNWTGNAIDPSDVINAIDFIIKSKSNTCIEEIIVWVNLDHN